MTIEFKENSDKYIGWMEAATGIGLTIGPALGSAIFCYTNYTLTFVIYGFLLLLGTIAIAFILPSRINTQPPQD